MQAKSFELSDLNNYRLFYRLTKFSGFDTFEIYHQQVDGLTVFEDCMVLNVYGSLVVAVPDQFKHTGKYNLIATDGEKTEIVNLHPFERVWDYYKLGHANDNPGAFTLLNSVPAYDETRSWRCDYGLYGPEIFEDPSGRAIIEVPQDLQGLVVYEPLLSVNGVAHLTYAVRTDKTNREQMINDSFTPFASQTFGGAVKLITEWAAMVGPPFGNEEDIALKADEFCKALGITEDLVSDQPNMQIYRYLNGEDIARVAPTPLMFSESLDLFLKKSMAHSSFSSLLACYPDMQIDMQEVLEIEKGLIESDIVEFLDKITIGLEVDYSDREGVLRAIDTHNHAGLSGFTRLKLGFLDTKKRLLLAIENNEF